MRFRFTIRDLLWLVLIVEMGCSQAQPPTVDPLPRLTDIDAVEAEFSGATVDKPGRFLIPQSSSGSVLDAMRPARIDTNPAGWQDLGEFQITRKAGRPLHVYLFDLDTAGEPGAFAAVEPWEERIYYRGGDSSKLKEALRMARRSNHRASF